MARPLSADLRMRVVDAYLGDKKLSIERAAKLFGVGSASLKRWLKKYREEGSVEAKPMGGDRRTMIDDDGLVWLRELAPKHPDAIIEDFVKLFEERTGIRVSADTMGRALHRAGLSRKKKLPIEEAGHSGRHSESHRLGGASVYPQS